MAGIALDAREAGGRLDATERRAFTSWAPSELGGEQFEDISKLLGGVEDDEEDGSALFADDEDGEDETARFAA